MTALADIRVTQTARDTYREPDSPRSGPTAVSDAVLPADRSGTVRDHARTMRSWPLLVLAVPAAAESMVRLGRHRAEDRLRHGLPPAGHLVLAPSGHSRHPAGRGRVLRGLRAACLAGHRTGDQRPDPAVRQAVGDLLIRARHGRAGRVPPDGPGPDHTGTLGHHHPRVLPSGPGPGHGDRTGPHAARGRRSSRACTDQRPRTSHSRAAGLAPSRPIRGSARPEPAGPDRQGTPRSGPDQDAAPA